MDKQKNNQPGKPANRRDFLKVGGLVGVASVLAACGGTVTAIPTDTAQIPTRADPTLAPTPSAQQSIRESAVRIAHISDMHIGPEGPGLDGFKRALRNVQARKPKIDFILNTGDSVGDALGATRQWAQAEWDAFNGVLKTENSLPIRHAIGNHDVWGWSLPAKTPHSRDPLFAKDWAVRELGIPDRYYTFDNAGWRFLVLDSTQLPPAEFPEYAKSQPYIGMLDEGQYNWLARQLEATPPTMPVCVVSHIPILSACELLDGKNEVRGNWLVPGAWVHIDARRLWSLFWQHPNVRLCLSGHTHQVEDLQYHGVRYLSDGAICANWWNGPYMDFPPGYVVVSLYKDGSSDNEFVAY